MLNKNCDLTEVVVQNIPKRCCLCPRACEMTNSFLSKTAININIKFIFLFCIECNRFKKFKDEDIYLLYYFVVVSSYILLCCFSFFYSPSRSQTSRSRNTWFYCTTPISTNILLVIKLKPYNYRLLIKHCICSTDSLCQ